MNHSSTTFAAQARRSTCAKTLLTSAALACILIAGGWFARAPLLKGLAQWWIVTDSPLTPADAVVVLGGGIETRPFAAAEYYHKGLTRKILVSDVRLSRSERLGVFPSQRELNQTVLMQLGVPTEAIETLGSGNRSTRDEALALRQWAKRASARSIIVPTEVFSSRRVKWMMEAALRDTGAQIQVSALDSEDYARNDWWQHALGLLAFQNEALKYVYYQVKH